MNQRGRTLLELIVVVALLLIGAAAAAPALRAYSEQAHALGAGRLFKGEFQKARSMAVRGNVQTAIRFEPHPDGWYFSTYRDGNHNGVLRADIASGRDQRVAGPFKLTGPELGVRVAINPGVPAIPPETGTLDTGDPIRFGRSDMVSFSPLGTATPGTLYIAGKWIQTAVRVNGQSSRVRLMVFAAGRWSEQ